MKNGVEAIGLFQGMFAKNTLSFNHGWDSRGSFRRDHLPKYTYISITAFVDYVPESLPRIPQILIEDVVDLIQSPRQTPTFDVQVSTVDDFGPVPEISPIIWAIIGWPYTTD